MADRVNLTQPDSLSGVFLGYASHIARVLV